MSSTIAVSRKQEELARSVISGRDAETISTSPEGERAQALPPELSQLIRRVLEAIATGQTVTLQTLPEELSTTTAARELGISRPTLMKMIHNGEIAAHKVGSHHRLKRDDVRAVRRAQLARQREALDELLQLEDGLE